MERLGVHRKLAERFGRPGDVVWTLLASAVLMSINAWLAYALRSALVFASLGPIILQTIDEPLARPSSPRSAILGNAAAIVVGYATLAAFGLLHTPEVTVAGVSATRAVATAVALGMTGAVIVALRALHPPAGATSLLVSLGFVRAPIELLLMFGGVVLIVAAGFALNRLAGVEVPWWAPHADAT